jgi:hypothetical protein
MGEVVKHRDALYLVIPVDYVVEGELGEPPEAERLHVVGGDGAPHYHRLAQNVADYPPPPWIPR